MGKKFVITDIPAGSAYAYRKGDLIEDDAVQRNGLEDYVASITSKEAKQVREELGIAEPDKTETSAAAGGKDKASA